MVKANTTPLEAEEQQAFHNWLTMMKLPHSAIPNSTFTTSWAAKNRNKAMGLCPGLPDMMVIIPRDRSNCGYALQLWVELKRKKGGKITSEQIEWMALLDTIEDVETHVAYGAEDAIQFVKKYLNGKR